MLRFVMLLTAVSVALGVNYDGLRAKFGWSGALEDKEYFFKIPRTVTLADGAGWRRTERAHGPMPSLTAYCLPNDLTVCGMYHTTGFIAGVQIAVPVEALQTVPYNPEKMFVKWRGQVVGGVHREFWTSTLYFVSEESMGKGEGPTPENGATLQDGGLYTRGTGGDMLLPIPLSESELVNTHFKKQNCVPNMGTHYYYNMTSTLACTDYFPWFMLVKDGQVVGAGFQIFGRAEKLGERDWFERPPARAAEITIPSAPACVSEWTSAHGVLSLHLYFVEKPWEIRCEDGDSLQPMSVVNRLLLNTNRYASKLYDEAKKLFSG